MLNKNKSSKNYIDLLSLKTNKLLEKQNLNIVLDDDIWDKDTLIVKSGGHLTESLINKLIKFGIKQVSVDFSEYSEDRHDPELKNFNKTRTTLIIENNLATSGWLVKNLTNFGFHRENIFITDDYNSINQYFRAKKINFIFINSSFYEKSPRCVDKYSLLKNTHAFVILEENESARKLKKAYGSEVIFLMKPLHEKRLNSVVNQALSQNLLDFHMDETQIS